MRGQRKTAKNFLSYQLAALDPHLSTSLHRYILISKEMGEKVIHCIKKQSSYLDPLGGWKNIIAKSASNEYLCISSFPTFPLDLNPPFIWSAEAPYSSKPGGPKMVCTTPCSANVPVGPRKVRGLDALVAAVSPGEDRKKRTSAGFDWRCSLKNGLKIH